MLPVGQRLPSGPGSQAAPKDFVSHQPALEMADLSDLRDESARRDVQILSQCSLQESECHDPETLDSFFQTLQFRLDRRTRKPCANKSKTSICPRNPCP